MFHRVANISVAQVQGSFVWVRCVCGTYYLQSPKVQIGICGRCHAQALLQLLRCNRTRIENGKGRNNQRKNPLRTPR
jgi:hypothetical protein